jgi:hypothetical protein
VAGGTPAAADDTTDPTLSIAFTPQSPTPGDTVTITATVTPGTNPDSTGLGVNCNLSWAGLGSSAALNPDVTGLVFSRDVVVPSNAVPGERVGSCTVSDDQERSSFAPYSLTIASAAPADQPPTVSAGGPYAVDEGGSVQLTASGTDPEDGILAYAWDLDDNGTFETSGQTVSFAAGDGPATPNVAVRVTDVGGLTATAATTVTVANVAPTATFTAPASADAGFPFALSLTSPQDPSAADTTVGFTYAFDCGSGYGAFGSASTASCPTSGVGTRSVGGMIRDKDGDVTEYRASVRVTVTFSSLCDLVRSYSTDPKVADDLCAKLAQAESAATATARDGALGAFRNQVDAKTGKGLTADQAAELKLLSMLL